MQRPLAKLPPEFRGYTLSVAGIKRMLGTIIPDQAKLVLQILNRAMSPEKPVLNEPEVREVMELAVHSGVLVTRRTSWQVFCEQRRFLIARGALLEVCLDPLAGLNAGIDPEHLQ